MKTFKNIVFVSVLALAMASCKNETQPEVKIIEVEVAKMDMAQNLDPNATYAKVEFSIDGMTCAMGCAKTIEKKMAKMEGVKMAKVDFDKRLAMVEYDEAKVSPASLEETVAKVSDVYIVKDMKIVEDFSKESILCAADCKKECCKGKTEAEKRSCSKDCTKACCSEAKQVK